MREKFLRKRLEKLVKKKDTIAQRANASTDVAEVRSLTEQVNDINDEISDINEELAAIAEDTRSNDPVTADTPIPATATRSNATIARANVGSFVVGENRDSGNVLESMEYREAFRALWTRGTPIPQELMSRARAYIAELPEEQRAGIPINTSNTAAVIPLTIMREVINKIRTPYGNILDRVRQTSLPGAVEYPIGEFEAEFHTVTEGTVSPEQDIGNVGKISFGYFEAELRISQTFLSALLSIDAFEAEISTVITRAYRKYCDTQIASGSGNGEMTGLAISCPKTVTMTAAQISDWRQWYKLWEASIEPGYEDGVFIFARSTVIKYLKTMSDANNRPLFYDATGGVIGDGDMRANRGYIFGREILMTQPNIVKDFDTANSSEIFGYFFQPDNYCINFNYGFTVDRYYNYEKRKWITVATMVFDGKPINNKGFMKFVKG